MSQVTSIGGLHFPIEFDAPQIQVRLGRDDWNKLCKLVEIVPLSVVDYNYVPDAEVGIFVLKKQATGKAQNMVDYVLSENPESSPLWYSPFPYDPTSCKECGSKEAEPRAEHTGETYCEACTQIVQMRKDAMTEHFEWVQKWHRQGLEFDDLLALSKGSVSVIASIFNSLPNGGPSIKG